MGGGNSKAQTVTVFTNNEKIVNDFLQETNTKIEMNSKINAQISNSVQVGKRVMIVNADEGANVDVGIDASQANEAQILQQVSALVNEIFNSSEQSDVKLDALATVAQEAKNSKMFTAGKDGAETNVTNNTTIENTTKVIKNLSLFINVLADVELKNEAKFGDMEVLINAAKNSNVSIRDKVNQRSLYYSDQLIDLVNSSETVRSLGNSASLTSEIESTQKSYNKGTVEGVIGEKGIGGAIGDAIGGIFEGALKGLLGPIVLVVIGIIILIIVFKVIGSMTKSSNTQVGGNYQYRRFYY